MGVFGYRPLNSIREDFMPNTKEEELEQNRQAEKGPEEDVFEEEEADDDGDDDDDDDDDDNAVDEVDE